MSTRFMMVVRVISLSLVVIVFLGVGSDTDYSTCLVFATQKSYQGTFHLGISSQLELKAPGHLVGNILEKIGYTVKFNETNPTEAYSAIEKGTLDLFIGARLPWMDAQYNSGESRGKFVHFGPIFEDYQLGWIIPDYISKRKLDSVTDLSHPQVKAELKSKIIGIESDSELMIRSHQMMEEYPGLEGYKLIAGGSEAMVDALAKAIEDKAWVVVTGWSPHYIWARFSPTRGRHKLRFLKEPKGILGGEEYVSMVAKNNFFNRFPNLVTEFLSRFYLSSEMLNEFLLKVNEEGINRAVEEFVANHPALITDWFDDGRLLSLPDELEEQLAPCAYICW